MDDKIQKFLVDLINDCLQSEHFAHQNIEEKKKTEEALENHFYDVVIKKLIESLTDDQVLELKSFNPADPDAESKIEELAGSVPNFGEIAQDILQKEAEKIKQTGQISQEQPLTEPPKESNPW